MPLRPDRVAGSGKTVIAGVDIGGTKTRVMLARGGQVLADRTVPTDSWRIRQVEPDGKALAGLVSELCAEQGLAADDLGAVAVGAHGCDTDAQCRQFQASLARYLRGIVRVVN